MYCSPRHLTKSSYSKAKKFRVFKEVKESLQTNKGNRSVGREGVQKERVETIDDILEYIEEQVELHGECVFWIFGYPFRSKKEEPDGPLEIGQPVTWRGKPLTCKVGGKELEAVPFLGDYKVIQNLKYETLKNRIIAPNKVEKEGNCKPKKIQSKKVRSEDYKLEKCHYFGVFNVDEKNRGWALMKVVTKITWGK